DVRPEDPYARRKEFFNTIDWKLTFGRASRSTLALFLRFVGDKARSPNRPVTPQAPHRQRNGQWGGR
ncbi:hypothetical protein NRY65_05555, partial [Acidithiobacillus ferrooxidans]|uniref:hypothetical protein n=1 Tax=Acidithiobacillus ferrooxidans TaxID=920 RepID=UPI002148628E